VATTNGIVLCTNYLGVNIHVLTKGTTMSEKIFNQLMRNGWSPVPYKHHPIHVKEAIKKANFRPQAKECFRNSQRIVCNWHNYTFRYVEGIVSALSVLPIAHAWIIDEQDVHHDITLNPAPNILCYKIYDRTQVIENIARTSSFTCLDDQWINCMQSAAMFGFDLNLPFEEIKKKLLERYEKLCKIELPGLSS